MPKRRKRHVSEQSIPLYEWYVFAMSILKQYTPEEWLVADYVDDAPYKKFFSIAKIHGGTNIIGDTGDENDEGGGGGGDKEKYDRADNGAVMFRMTVEDGESAALTFYVKIIDLGSDTHPMTERAYMEAYISKCMNKMLDYGVCQSFPRFIGGFKTHSFAAGKPLGTGSVLLLYDGVDGVSPMGYWISKFKEMVTGFSKMYTDPMESKNVENIRKAKREVKTFYRSVIFQLLYCAFCTGNWYRMCSDGKSVGSSFKYCLVPVDGYQPNHVVEYRLPIQNYQNGHPRMTSFYVPLVATNGMILQVFSFRDLHMMDPYNPTSYLGIATENAPLYEHQKALNDVYMKLMQDPNSVKNSNYVYRPWAVDIPMSLIASIGQITENTEHPSEIFRKDILEFVSAALRKADNAWALPSKYPKSSAEQKKGEPDAYEISVDPISPGITVELTGLSNLFRFPMFTKFMQKPPPGSVVLRKFTYTPRPITMDFTWLE